MGTEQNIEIELFRGQLEKFADKMNINLETVVKKLAIDAFNGVIKRTPVDTGRARASWNISVNRVNSNVPRVKDKGKKYSKPRQPKVRLKSPYDVVYITSNLDYMQYLEQGSSIQAPLGMVAITINEIQTFLDRSLKDVT